jgi:TP901 family phage tail tape measure protein
MAMKNDTAKTTVIVDGKQGISELGKLEMQARELKESMKGVKRSSDEYVLATKKLKGVNKDIAAQRKELGLTGMTLNQLTRYQRELNNEIRNNATQGTAHYRSLEKELHKVTKAVDGQRASLRGTKGIWSSIKTEVKQFGAIAIGYLGISALASQVESLISGSARLADAMTDVQKTTELTDTEMEQLLKRFKGFNTRTPRKELLALADEAGKMGKRGVNAVAEYVEQTNELTTALSDLGDDAGLSVAKMADRFGVSMRQIGSGINAVADNTKAKAGFITEFLSRVSGTANEVGIAAGDILGYGAAIDEMGLKVEMSSTAINGFLIDFVKNTEMYGEAAGYAQGELSKLVGEKGTNQGFIAFLERLRELNPEAKDFLNKLEDIGIDGDRGSQVFLALAQNVGQLRDRQALANREIEKGTSLTEEYNKKNNNLAGSLEKVQKFIAGKFINSAFMGWLGNVVGKMSEWIKIPLSETIEKDAIKLNTMRLELSNVNTDTNERLKLIRELKTEYPDYLNSIDEETISNEELFSILDRVNESLVERLIVQRKLEEVEEAANTVADTKLEKLEKEAELRELIAKMALENRIRIPAELKTLEEQVKFITNALKMDLSTVAGRGEYGSAIVQLQGQIGRSSRQLTEDEAALNAVLEEKRRIIEALDFQSKKSESSTEDADSAKPAPKKAITYVPDPADIKAQLDNVLKALDDGNAQLVEEVRQQYNNRLLEEEQFQNALKQLQLSTLIAKKEAMTMAGENTLAIDQQINDMIFDLQQQANTKVDAMEAERAAYYDELADKEIEAIIAQLDEKKKLGEDEQAFYDEMADKKIEADKKKIKSDEEVAEAKRKAVEAEVFFAAQSTFAAVQSAETAEEAGAAIINSIRAQIAARIQQAIAEAMVSALSKVPFPFNIVLAAAAGGAVSLLFKKLLPPAQTKSQKKEASQKRGLYHGGDTGNETTGEYDRYGAVSMGGPGFNLHGNELVIPSYERNDPVALNTEAYFKAKNPNFKSSLNAAAVPSMGMSPAQADAMIQELQAMRAAFSKYPTMIKSYTVLSEHEAKQLEMKNARGKKL